MQQNEYNAQYRQSLADLACTELCAGFYALSSSSE